MAHEARAMTAQRHLNAVARNESEQNPVITPYKKREAKTFYDKNGIIIDKRPIELADGMQYHVLSSRINKHLPSGLDGVAYQESVAFCTRPEGLYVHRLIKMAELGIEGTVISSPQNFGRYFTFDQNAHNHLSIIHNEAMEFDRDPDFINLGGISQGAMYGNGVIDLAPKHGINVLTAHLNVPCLPNGFHPTDIEETLRKAPNELTSFGTYTKMGLLALSRMAPTADLSKEALYVQAQCLPALMSGETGRHARNINTDLMVLVEVFLGDFLSRGRVWRDEIYKDKPNVKVVARNGGSHLHCVNPESHMSFMDFETAVATILRENPHIRANPQNAAKQLYTKIIEQYPEYRKDTVV